MNKNSQTTSTKCQYQAAASNPKWWVLVKWFKLRRSKQINKNTVPIITWSPWNPVAIKNVDPYTASAIEKEASKYSNPWRDVKYSPSKTVIKSPWIPWEWLFSIIAWWAHVTVTPDARRMAVFSRGIWKGLKGLIPTGGHALPISTAGARLLWKKAQKKETKNKTSEVINKIIPHRNPTPTIEVCNPWYVPSRTTSRHHWSMISIVEIRPNKNRSILKVWNHLAVPETNDITLNALSKGQGLLSTRWNGWFIKFDI